MKPQQWEYAKRLFEAALNKKPEERASFLEETCGGDASLCNQVVSLLEQNDRAGSFLERTFWEQSDAAPSSIQQDIVFRINSVIMSRFRIVSLAGRGGMGEVYEAEDLELHDLIALKTIRSEIARDPEIIARFKREIQLARRITHRNVIRLFDLFTFSLEEHEKSGPGLAAFVTMQFLPGITLAETIRQSGPLPTNELISVAVQICNGLGAAHKAGVIHRDFKTGNVMLVPSDNGESRAVITDFGLALRTVSNGASDWLTGSGARIGTLPYMAPEQIEGGIITPATDIYALGIVLFEMATGTQPFVRESPLAAALNRPKQPPKSLRLIRPDLDARWQTLILKCIEYYPEQRYQTTEALEVELKALEARLGRRDFIFTPGFMVSTLPPPIAKVIGRLKAVFSAPVLRDWRPSTLVRVSPTWLWGGTAVALAAGLILFSWLLPWRAAQRDAAVPVAILTSLPGLERAPSFSPDGNQIAFTWSAGPDQANYIYVQMVSGTSAPLCLTPKAAFNTSPAWSPDGQQLAFLRRERRDRADIHLISPLGGPERLLTSIEGLVDRSPPPSLSWSPNGRWIITHGSAAVGGPSGLLLVDTSSGDKHLLSISSIEPPWGDADPAFSPDGRAIVFVRRLSDSSANLCVWSIASSGQLVGEPRILANNRTSWFSHPGWTPDGRSIIYTCRRIQNDSTLWRIPSSGGQPHQITLAGSVGSVLDAAVAPRCCRLAFASQVIDPNIWSVQLDRPFGHASQPRLLTGSSRLDGNPQLSPDGSHLVYFSDSSGLFQIWVAARDGSSRQQLTHFTEGHSGTPRWSPDNRSIVFDSTSDGNPDIYLVDTSGTAPRRLTNHPAADAMPSFSPDGKWIYFGSNRSGRFEIWRMNSSGRGEAKQITRHGGNVAFVSPDRRLIYYQKDYLSGPLYAMALDGGEEFQAVPSVLSRAFFPAGEGVYFITFTRERQIEIAFWNASTRQVHSVAPLGNAHVWLGLSVSADERFFVYSQHDRYESDLLLIDNFQ
jgi:Tol biopolymer transport system component